VLGTAAMTAWQELSIRLQSSDEPKPASADPWERAPAPAKVARLILRSIFGVDVGPEKIGLVTNVSHWAYGTGWGAVYALIRRDSGRPAAGPGMLFGAGVWAMSYVQLVPLGIYELPWKYPGRVLALDLSYHLVYGEGVAVGYAALTRGR
jgi:hypothetical protein